MGRQPKKYINRVSFSDKEQGYSRRVSYGQTITEKAPIIPKPLEYEDIDKAFMSFIDNEIDITVDGKKVPTFTLYSSQRFSEYSQTWQHTDEDNNLLMNFKTVNRDSNPSKGDNQGGYWNIPGDRYYTLLTRTVLDDSGREVYEIYSMKQPCSIDLSFKVNFVTNIYENLNRFNEKINDIFKARQYYLRVNGHYLPMVIEEINDETQFGVEERKFYTQSISIKLMAYIIHENDFKIERKPKTAVLFLEGDSKRKIKPEISLEEIEDENDLDYGTIEVSIDFKGWNEKVEFVIDTDMIVDNIKVDNIRNYRIFINDELFYTEKGFKLNENDNVRIKIRYYDVSQPANMVLEGYNPNRIYHRNEVPEKQSDDFCKHEQIIIE